MKRKEIAGLLWNIRSLHNVGSIFRTSDAAGIKKLYLCGITPAPTDRFGKFRPEIRKVALGAEKSLSWETFPGNLSKTLKLIKKLKKDYLVLALEQNSKAKSIFKENKKIKNVGKILLICGNEVAGLPKSILSLADQILEIPMYGEKESLNVSVAFGIAAYRIR